MQDLRNGNQGGINLNMPKKQLFSAESGYRRNLAAVLGIMILFMMLTFFLVFYSGSHLFAREIYDNVLTVQKNHLRDTVNNLIDDIDGERLSLREEHPDWSQQQIDDTVKRHIYERIHHTNYNDNAYVWVEQVLNYDGGDRYAIRLIHPNLTKTEGYYLSTDMTDLHGNHPYADELSSIRRDGEVFHTYYFKKLDSDEVTEKMAYAKLYKDFDWIISMGTNIDDMDHYIHQSQEHMIPLMRMVLFVMFLSVLSLCCLAILFIRHSDHRLFQQRHRELQQQINWDTLTSAHSRKYGQKLLEREWKQFQQSHGTRNAAIMMLDIDHFKQVNDRYGHEAGDRVLREVVTAVRRATRSSDHIIRWGGDEFIGVFSGLNPQYVDFLITKILQSVAAISVPVQDSTISVTVSLGFSYFHPKDTDIRAVLERADTALYRAKQKGRNQGCLHR